MSEVAFAQLLIVCVRAYLAAGALFAIGFVTLGLERIDPSASHSTYGFRIVIIPGVVVLWPLLLLRIMKGRSAPIERTAHREAASRGGDA